jgi:hypothetical protein
MKLLMNGLSKWMAEWDPKGGVAYVNRTELNTC